MSSLYNKTWNNIIESTSVNFNIINYYKEIYLIIFILLFTPNFIWISSVPDALYNPPIFSLAMFFSGFPNIYIVIFFQAFLILSLVLISINRFSFLFGVISFVILIIFYNISFSLGKIDHFILLPLSLFCFSLGNWKKNNKYFLLPIPPETLLAIFIGFGMFTAGFQKAISWIDFDLKYSGFLSWFYSSYFNHGNNILLANLVFKLPNIIIELFDYLAVFFELSALPIILFSRKIYWKFWLLAACCFHLLNILFFNIAFTFHILVYLSFLLPNHKIYVKNWSKISKWILTILGLSQLILYIRFNSSLIGLLKINYIYLSLILWSLMIFVAIYSIYIEIKKPTTNS